MNASLKRSLTARYGVDGTLSECCHLASQYVPSPLRERLMFLSHQLTLPSSDPLRLDDRSLKLAASQLTTDLPEPWSSRLVYWVRILLRSTFLLLAFAALLLSVQVWGYAAYPCLLIVVSLRWRVYPHVPAVLLVILFAALLYGLYLTGSLAASFILPVMLALLYSAWEL